MTTDDTRPCNHEWEPWFANTSKCSCCGARRDDLTTDDTRPHRMTTDEWQRHVIAQLDATLDAERTRHAALVAAAREYVEAVDADLYREGTPEDWWRREAALAALRAALDGEPR
jgi:hypothetical protein